MQGLKVALAEKDQRGARKENIFLATDARGKGLGSVLLYPFFAHDTEPEHPHNIYLHFQPAQESELSEPVKDLLLEHALLRATIIKAEAVQPKTRVYACFTKQNQAQMNFFLQRGFKHDEGMLILEREESGIGAPVDAPPGITIQPWRMEREAEQRRFIATHRMVFPRHPYTLPRLQELRSKPGWGNFGAWSGSEIAGNIMFFEKEQGDDRLGIIEDLFVLKPWRRRGIARALLQCVLHCLQDRGIRRVQLEMWSANKPAFALYRRFGFAVVDETQMAVGRYV